MKIVIDNRRRETYSDRLSIVGDNQPITIQNSFKISTGKLFVLGLSSVRRAICLHQWDRYRTS
jgi:hypothetical protein